jgi:hypothetical protein
MSIARAIGALGALGGGVVSGMESNERNARDKEERALRNQLTQLQLKQAQRTDAKESAIDAASQDVTPTLNAPGDGVGPSAVMVGKDAFGENQTDQANAAAAAANAPEAKTARRLGVLRSVDPMRADQEESAGMDMKLKRQALAKTIESEGALDFVNQNFQAAPSVADIESGKVGLFQLNGVDGFNKAGKIKIRDGSMGKWQVLDLGNGRKVADFTVVDAGGKPLTTMTGRTLEAVHGMSLKERELLADKRVTDGRDYELKKSEAEARGAYLQGLVSNGAAKVDATQGIKIPDAVKLSVDDIDAQKQAIIKQLEMATPATLPGLNEQLAGLSIQRRKLLSPYMNQQGSAPDPLGLGGAPKRPGGSPSVAPASAPAGPGRSPDSDRALILNAELEKAQQARDAAAPGSDAWIRADADVKSVARELGQKPASAPAPAKPKAAPAKAAAPSAAPAPSLAAGQASKQGAAPSMLDAAGEWLSGISKDYSTPEGKKELQGRVKESKQGGKPLTKTETLRAQQAGLI